MSPIPTITTERLILRPLTVGDATDLLAVMSDPLTMRYWHTPPYREAADVAAMLEAMLAHAAACWWAISLPDAARVLGFVGYHGTTIPGMGYILHADYWRRGYGSAAVQAALADGFTRQGLNRVELWIHHENLASRRLAEKLGFTCRGSFAQRYAHLPSPHETLVYGLRAAEWAAQSGTPTPVAPELPFYAVAPVLPVYDVAATLDFYRDRLGFTIEYSAGQPPDFAIVGRGEWSCTALRLHFTRVESSVALPLASSLYVTVGAAIDALYAEYQAKAVTITSELATLPWGRREFAVVDCNGYELVFGSAA